MSGFHACTSSSPPQRWNPYSRALPRCLDLARPASPPAIQPAITADHARPVQGDAWVYLVSLLPVQTDAVGLLAPVTGAVLVLPHAVVRLGAVAFAGQVVDLLN